MSRLFQCVSKTCRLTEEDKKRPGCLVMTFSANKFVDAISCPLYDSEGRQKFVELR